MATRAERELARCENKVVSVRDKIKEYQEKLRMEEEKEQQAKTVAISELVRNMNVSYDDLKNAVNIAKTTTIIPTFLANNNEKNIPEATVFESTKTEHLQKPKEEFDNEEID